MCDVLQFPFIYLNAPAFTVFDVPFSFFFGITVEKTHRRMKYANFLSAVFRDDKKKTTNLFFCSKISGCILFLRRYF